MGATMEDVLRELRSLRKEVHELKDILIPEVELEQEEIEAIERGRAEYKKGEFVKFRHLRT